MEKCLIIMPQGDAAGYPSGHVNRVYDYIIAPACRLAGYLPTREDNGVHDDPLEVVREIVDSEVAILDLSAGTTNGLYSLAIRKALGLPVVLVKDIKTFIALDLNDFDTVEYDDSLRIDTVQKSTELLSEALKAAVQNKKEKHEILSRLRVGLPKEEANTPSFIDSSTLTEPVEEEPKKPRLPIISPLPDYVGEPLTEKEIDKLKPGDFFFHLNHGKGKVNFVKKDKLASIEFDSGAKFLVLVPSDFLRKINE